MINSIEIKNFKGIKELKLENFTKINFFVGKANTGKTSILEALYLFLLENQNDIMLLLDTRKMLADSDLFQGFFYDYNLEKKPLIENDKNKLKIDCDKNTKYTNFPLDKQDNIITEISNGVNEINFIYENFEGVKTIFNIKKTFPNPGQIQFQQAMNLQLNGKKEIKISMASNVDFIYQNSFYDKNLINHLSLILSNKQKRKDLQRICKDFSDDIEELSFINGKIVIQKSNLNHSINFKLLGEGFKKYINIQASILAGKKYILIDELENGLHYESIEKLLKDILNTDDVQFFITTHNLELLKKLSEILYSEKNEKVSVFNVYENKNNKIKSVKLTQEELINNIENNNEIRD
ncbi:AAA family ATPase [Campylobacter sp. RM9929]|uniref:AAA family ATPase n=1 Tax=Campylobacter molothri TaxID=1032242 RepID=UPI001D2BBAA8|nr:AAA family ATPase [Campylobacter sp. RM9929]